MDLPICVSETVWSGGNGIMLLELMMDRQYRFMLMAICRIVLTHKLVKLIMLNMAIMSSGRLRISILDVGSMKSGFTTGH